MTETMQAVLAIYLFIGTCFCSLGWYTKREKMNQYIERIGMVLPPAAVGFLIALCFAFAVIAWPAGFFLKKAKP